MSLETARRALRALPKTERNQIVQQVLLDTAGVETRSIASELAKALRRGANPVGLITALEILAAVGWLLNDNGK